MNLKDRVLSLIVSGELDHQVGHLAVVARDVLADDFLLLTPIARLLPYLDDVSLIEGYRTAPDSDIPTAVSTPEPSHPATWADFAEEPVTGA